MRRFSHQILLYLFGILNAFYYNIWVNIKAKRCERCKQFKYYHEMRLKCQIKLTKFC